ncbi:ABC transporter ATP-binding protein [Tropicibacter alexandrii]|uniref:ABC transporter ATP-binding protein n=1 Tax=Tropicibacter alexandrii TaxID=2267683 RepID=UPI000EF48DCB|nr:ABC transporter ATP-binding protein [Tropicibacter alexandrii]
MFILKNVYYSYSGASWADLKTCRDRVPGVLVENLVIAPDGVTAIIGPSGSGKTTLLSLLSGFIAPQFGPEGVLSFNGTPLWQLRKSFTAVSFVFQSPMLLGAGSAVLNMLPGRVAGRGADWIEADELGDIVSEVRDLGLSGEDRHLLAKRSRDLSGGEKQRVAILRALIANRQAILCDEPTSSLDDSNADLAMGALRNWSHLRKRPVIWVTHDLDQAAKYAKHYVFVSAGRIHRAEETQLAQLNSENVAQRLAALREISAGLSGAPDTETSRPDMPTPERPIRIGRLRFASWIAHALSTDGLRAVRAECGAPGALLPPAQTALVRAIDPDHIAPMSTPRRWWWQAQSYSGFGLALIVLVLMTQIFAAGFGGMIANRYSAERLRDPAVARIGFVHKSLPSNLGRPEPDVLYSGEDGTIKALESDIRDELAKQAPEADPDRVKVFGRRAIDSSSLIFLNGSPICRQAVPLNTVVLNRNDPILRETRLSDEAGLPSDLQRALQVKEPAIAGLPTVPRLLIDADWLDLVREKCDLPANAVIEADWAAGQAGELKRLRVEIGGAVKTFPTLYPSVPQLLATEDAFQQAAQLFDNDTPGGFRTANAYFPVEGFAATRKVLYDKGYTQTDDSERAVATLRDMARAAETVPFAIVGFNLAACAVVFILVIGSQLELNKRVLALFVAHGFRLWETAVVMLIHLIPAVLLAGVVLSGSVLLFWGGVKQWLPAKMLGLELVRNLALSATVGLVIVAAVVTICGVVAIWWYRTRDHLKSYLQE